MAAAAEVKHLVVTHLRGGAVDEAALRAGLAGGRLRGPVDSGCRRVGGRGVRRRGLVVSRAVQGCWP